MTRKRQPAQSKDSMVHTADADAEVSRAGAEQTSFGPDPLPEPGDEPPTNYDPATNTNPTEEQKGATAPLDRDLPKRD